MDIRDTTVDAVVLKVRDYKECDKLLIYFSLELGKGVAIAKGAAKPGGSLRAAAQPFCRAKLTLSPSKGGVSYLKAAEAETSFVSLNASLSTIAYCSYVAELADIAMPEYRPSQDFFSLLLAAFSMLKMDDHHRRTALFFESRLLLELGLLPQLAYCNDCRRSLSGGTFHLSPKAGALLCAGCGKTDPSPTLSAGSVLTLRRLLEAPLVKIAAIKISDELTAELETALSYFLDYHLDYSSKAKAILQQLLD